MRMVFLLIIISAHFTSKVFGTDISHEEAKKCYQNFYEQYLQVHDDEDYSLAFSSLGKDRIQAMFTECHVKDDFAIREMLKLSFAYDFNESIVTDSSEPEDLITQKKSYDGFVQRYGYFASENEVQLNLPTFGQYQESQVNRKMALSFLDIGGNAAEFYQYLADQSKTIQKFNDEQIAVLLDKLLFRYLSDEGCQSYCPLIFKEFRKLLASHPLALKYLSENYSGNRYVWQNINNDYYTSSERFPSPFDDVLEKKKNSLVKLGKEANGETLIPHLSGCYTDYWIDSELRKIQERTHYVFLITDECSNKISLKNIPGTLFSLKLEIRNSDNQLQYLNIFSAKKRSDVVKMIREALK